MLDNETETSETPPPLLAAIDSTVWPPDYVGLFAWRQQQLLGFKNSGNMLIGAKHYYKTHPIEFICDWVDTYDPRNAGQKGKITRMPFVMFDRQKDMVKFLQAMLEGEENGLIEKCRDAGATWVCVAFSVWLWLFWPGISVGWGSRKEQLVDKIGVVDSIFEKIRLVIKGLPSEFLPEGFEASKHLAYMRVINPETDATIVGEAGDNIGRGGRTRIYFKDESAHYERPELIEAALGDNTRCQIDISSVNGVGNVFYRKREAGEEWEGDKAVENKTNIFVFDWRHHPEKNQKWYDTRRKRYEDEGMLHIFSQEVDRDYAASIQGVLIKTEWIKAAVDAHIKLGFDDSGKYMGAIDVADGGIDKDAFAIRKGVVLKYAKSWAHSEDAGVTTQNALLIAQDFSEMEIQYDSIGVGAGVKTEANRLKREKLLKGKFKFTPWAASSKVLYPDDNFIKGDKSSPLNKDHFHNLKAQAWWMLRLRFLKTYKAITEGVVYDPSELISLDSELLGNINQIEKELSQAVAKLSSASLKLVVDKAPEGTRSPNIADSIVMSYWPIIKTTYTLDNIS